MFVPSVLRFFFAGAAKQTPFAVIYDNSAFSLGELYNDTLLSGVPVFVDNAVRDLFMEMEPAYLGKLFRFIFAYPYYERGVSQDRRGGFAGRSRARQRACLSLHLLFAARLSELCVCLLSLKASEMGKRPAVHAERDDREHGAHRDPQPASLHECKDRTE